MNNQLSNGQKAVRCLGLAILFVLVVLFFSSLTTVSASQRALVLNFGAFNGKVLDPGLHWLVPIQQSIVKMDVSVQKVEAEATAATKDLQDVHSKVALNFALDQESIGDIYLSFRGDHADRMIVPALQEAIKSATAKYTAEELITKRSEVRDQIKLLLKEKLTPHHVRVDEFNIVNFAFSPSFNRAIEEKVTAEQNALASKNKLEQTKYEAEQTIVSAKAQAESIRIQAEAIQQQGGENYVNLKAIEKWNGVLPAQFVPGSALPFVTLK